MGRLPLTAVCLLLVVSGAFAQTPRTPRFEQYPAKVEKARVKAIDFKRNPDAKTFRTRLSEAIREGVNFAGHYVVAGWGCGTGCISGAIIDARTGNVYWPIEFNALSVWYSGDSYADEPVAYRKDSRLIVISGSPGVKDGGQDKPQGKYYYEWKGNRLHLIKFVKLKSE